MSSKPASDTELLEFCLSEFQELLKVDKRRLEEMFNEAQMRMRTEFGSEIHANAVRVEQKMTDFTAQKISVATFNAAGLHDWTDEDHFLFWTMLTSNNVAICAVQEIAALIDHSKKANDPSKKSLESVEMLVAALNSHETGEMAACWTFCAHDCRSGHAGVKINEWLGFIYDSNYVDYVNSKKIGAVGNRDFIAAMFSLKCSEDGFAIHIANIHAVDAKLKEWYESFDSRIELGISRDEDLDFDFIVGDFNKSVVDGLVNMVRTLQVNDAGKDTYESVHAENTFLSRAAKKNTKAKSFDLAFVRTDTYWCAESYKVLERNKLSDHAMVVLKASLTFN